MSGALSIPWRGIIISNFQLNWNAIDWILSTSLADKACRYIEKIDVIVKIDKLSITFDKIWPIVDLNRIEIFATIDRTAEIGSKKSIKRRFESALDQILAGGRSNRINLLRVM